MSLLQILQQINDQAESARQPTDMLIGTVTGVDPLEVTLDIQQAALREEVLFLTDSVIEKKLGSDGRFYRAGVPLESNFEFPEGVELVLEYNSSTEIITPTLNPEDPGAVTYAVVTPALGIGDKVLLLSVMHGQKFIVLSRLY